MYFWTGKVILADIIDIVIDVFEHISNMVLMNKAFGMAIEPPILRTQIQAHYQAAEIEFLQKGFKIC